MTQPFEIWALRNNGEALVGSYNSLPRLKSAWGRVKGNTPLKAKQIVGDDVFDITDQMPVRPTKVNGLTEFRSAEERDGAIIDAAEYFTIVRFLGVGQYERHERKTRKEAIELGEHLSKEVRGNYIVYAINDVGRSAYVTSIIYKKAGKNAKT